jgi:hypothetical protein
MVRRSCLAFAIIIATFAVGADAVGWEFKAPGTWQAKQKQEAKVRRAAARRRRAVQAAVAAAAAGADEDCARTKRNLRAEVHALKRKVDLLAHEAASLRKRAAAAEAAAAGASGAADVAPGAATHFDPTSETGEEEVGLAQAATDYAFGKDEPFVPPTSSLGSSSSPSCDSPPALLDITGPAVEVPLSASDMDLPPGDAGNTARLERLVSKLRSGAPVSIVVFGGSVSAGHGCSFNMTYDGADHSDGAVYRPPYCADAGMAVVTAEIAGNKNWADVDGNKGGKVCPCTWSGALQLWLKRAFPHSRSSVSLHAIGARGIDHLRTTLPSHWGELAGADLVVLEYSLNNGGFVFTVEGPGYDFAKAKGTIKDYESIFHALLPLPSRPALLLLEFAFVSECQEVSGATRWDRQVANHYRVPVVDFHALAFAKYKAASSAEKLFYKGMKNGYHQRVTVPRRRLREGAAAATTVPDRALFHNMQSPPHWKKDGCSFHHPKAVLHHQMANTVARLLLRSWRSLCARGWKLDEAAMSAPLPKPMYNLRKVETPLYMRTTKGTPAAEWAASCVGSGSGDGGGAAVLGSCGAGGKSGWKLFEDRRDKPGWIGSAAGAQVAFKVPRGGCATKLVIGYMQSYASVGRVRVFMSPCAVGRDCQPRDGETAANSEEIEIDALEPKKHVSVYHELVVTKKQHPTWCNGGTRDSYVHFVVQGLTPAEVKKRGGSKFKLELLAGY